MKVDVVATYAARIDVNSFVDGGIGSWVRGWELTAVGTLLGSFIILARLVNFLAELNNGKNKKYISDANRLMLAFIALMVISNYSRFYFLSIIFSTDVCVLWIVAAYHKHVFINILFNVGVVAYTQKGPSMAVTR